MALGRATKISILLAIDLVFFFVELIVGMAKAAVSSFTSLTRSLPLGYAVGSLALVAYSFHMLKCVASTMYD